MAKITATPHDVLRNLKEIGATAEDVTKVWRGMDVATAQKLLDGSAKIVNVENDGSFDVG